jgi:EmrB/QacA subfamily drug resistance transporter
VLIGCVIASSMTFIDGSALTVALPKLRASFGADLLSVQWVLNGYVLALASFTLVGGAVADAYGKARTLAVGIILFGLTSAACALAPSATWLIATRVVQGIAAAIVAPASLALIGATYPRQERSRAIAVWAAASALTTAGGPVLGGWLTDSFGWQTVFLINPPLALIAVAVLGFAPADRRETRHFDVIGAAILVAAFGALAWALSQISLSNPGVARATALQSAIGVTFVGGLGCAGLGAYAFWERVNAHPMTPPRLAENRRFVGLNLATLMVYAGLSIMFFLLPFHLTDRRALPATDVGLTFLPFTLGVGFLSRVFAGLADEVGGRSMLIIGSVGAALAYVWMTLGSDTSLLIGVIAPMALLGLSFAALVTPLTGLVLSSVGEADEGLASGINNTASRIAQLAGVAFAAGVGPLAFGYEIGLAGAAVVSIGGAIAVAIMVPPERQIRASPENGTGVGQDRRRPQAPRGR